MADVASLLSVLQLSDSAFPSGRYTLSHGLEAFAQEGRLGGARPATALLTLLSDCLLFGVAPSDGVALACAHRATGRDGVLDLDAVLRADARLTAVKLARETRDASTRTGRALLGTAKRAFDPAALGDYTDAVEARRSPGNYAVVLGVLSAWLGVPRVEAVAGELYSFASGWLSAAVRLALTDPRTAQRLLHRLRPVAAGAAAEAAERDVSEISSCTPLPDVMSMRHEEAELRLFAS
jgi:urease accessory protein